MNKTTCRRPGCTETFTDSLRYDIHLLRDHPLPWEEIEGYPRAPEAR